MKKKVVYALFTVVAAICLCLLAACGKTVTFKINFMVEGQVYAAIDTSGDEVIRIPNDPKKENAVFEGWYWDEGTWTQPFTASSLLDTPLTSNISVYAKFRTEADATGTELRLEGFTLIETESLGKVYYISIPNSQIIYDVGAVVTIDNRSSWSLSTDLYGNNTIASKRVNLSIGDNIYYILVENRYGQSEQYTLLIRRRPMYQVYFVTEGGTSCDTQTVEEGYYATEPQTSREGYTFAAWNYDFTMSIMSDIWITASWTANEYTVMYDANGGTVTPATQRVTYDSYTELAIPTRVGYTFLGWQLDGSLFNGNRVEGTWKIARDVTLVAAWAGNKYPISYELNGGVNAGNNPTTYISGEKIILYAASKIGYTFNGWHEGNNFYTAAQLPLEIELGYGEKIFTASWTANIYTVTLNANGGECSATEISATYDAYTSLPTPTREGYTFDGWYYGNIQVSSGTWITASDCTLLAHWTPKTYPINYELAGGTNDSRNPSTYTPETETFTVYAPSRTGYTFAGWQIGSITDPVMSPVVNKGTIGNLSFTATWTANIYTVTFNSNEGKPIESINITFDSNVTLPIAERVGYTFNGWYYNSTRVDNGTWKYAQDITLTAQWIARDDTIYTVNHYIENVTDSVYVLKETETLKGTSDSSVTPAVMDYIGFTAPARETVTILPDGSRIVNYYYTRNSYTVSFVLNGGEEITPITQKFESVLTIPVGGRKDFTFGGWFEDYNLSAAYTDSTMPAMHKTVYAWWTEENKAADFVYGFNETVSITGYHGTGTSLIIPAYIGGKPVTSIGSEAFINQDKLTKLVIPDTISNVGEGAFKGCNALEQITLPFVGSSEEAMYYDAVFGYIFGRTFEYTTKGYKGQSGASATFVNTITGNVDNAIPQYSCYDYETGGYLGGGGQWINRDYGCLRTFYYYIPQTIREVTITKQTNIPVATFNNCNFIEKITIPEKAINIGAYAFQNCSLLTQLNSKTDGEYKIPVGVTVINDYVFYGNQQATKVTLGQDVTSIGNYAFGGCSLLTQFNSKNTNELVVTNKVEIIGEYAFQNVLLVKKVVVSNSVTSIGVGAFNGCNALEQITLPFIGSNEEATYYDAVFGYIFGWTFEYTISGYKGQSGASATFVSTVTGNVDNAIPQYSCYDYYSGNQRYGCLRTFYYYIPQTIKEVTVTKQTNIPVAAFNKCDFVEKIIIPENATNIGSYAFNNCAALKSLNSEVDGGYIIPVGVTVISDYVFYGNQQAAKVTLGQDVTSIGNYAFGGCSSLTQFNSKNTNELVIPNKVETIGEYAFQNVSLVTKVIVADRVASIGLGAFNGCNALEEITLPFVGNSAAATYYDAVFGYIFGRTFEYTISGYKGTSGVSAKFVNTVTGSVDNAIPQYSCYDYYGGNQRYGCLRTFYYYIPQTIREVIITQQTNIPVAAFNGCDFIEKITMAEDTTSIGSYAFYNCAALKSISLPGSVQSIDSYAFRGCSALERIVISVAVQSMGEYVFGDCSALTIYCRAASLPFGWDNHWNPDNRSVIWGYAGA